MGYESSSKYTSCDEPSVLEILKNSPNEHVDKSKVIKHVCTYENCNKSFLRPSKLLNHIQTHSGERTFKCNFNNCTKKYTNSSHLRRHVKSVHEQNSFVVKIRCTFKGCLQECSTQQTLTKHFQRWHSKSRRFQCPDCDESFHKKNQLSKHAYTHTGIAPYPCEKCNLRFIDISSFKKHQHAHKNYHCECGELFALWSLLMSHRKTCVQFINSKNFICTVCTKKFKSKTNLKSHFDIHSNKCVEFNCTYENCNKTYLYNNGLQRHIKRSHKTKIMEHQREDSKTPARKEKLQQCKENAKKLSKPLKLNRMKRKDTGKPKVAMALALSGLYNHGLSKKLLSGNGCEDLTPPEMSAGTDSEIETSHNTLSGLPGAVSTVLHVEFPNNLKNNHLNVENDHSTGETMTDNNQLTFVEAIVT